ncbi:hypothetical protein WQ54_03580 [Bacillus sp. SA1-12]|uniref:hypothetical protein n=1 Tax=Bacillus sp. SA1-12 TaxID=1455638 RepID=UPI0006254839|nr:hypothetical protein [Bacillus sp. SA1-12]KKI93330.1 hypothetical protein WQ54_03580 [Bacillus sp. SA1-12]
MNGLFQHSKEEKLPIEIIYISNAGEITLRTIIVKEINGGYIKAFCLLKQQPRLFSRSNILSASKLRRKNTVNFA